MGERDSLKTGTEHYHVFLCCYWGGVQHVSTSVMYTWTLFRGYNETARLYKTGMTLWGLGEVPATGTMQAVARRTKADGEGSRLLTQMVAVSLECYSLKRANHSGNP